MRTRQTDVCRSLQLPDVVLPIAEVGGVTEAAARSVALVAASAADVEALLHTAEGRANVFEFVVNVQGDFAQPDDQTEDSDRRDQNQLRRNNETGFVVLQSTDELEHERVFRKVGSVECSR